MENLKSDVIVIGGGPAGACAAVAAARTGARTLLIEKYGFLGGMGTSALFMPWRGFLQKGSENSIAEEIVNRLVNLGGSPGHLPDPTGASPIVTLFDIETLKFVLQELVTASGVELLLHANFISAEREGRRVASIRAYCREGIVDFSSESVVDATGCGYLSQSAGIPVTNLNGTVSYRFAMTNVDTSKIRSFYKNNPHEFSGASSETLPHLIMKGFTTFAKQWYDSAPELVRSDSIEVTGILAEGNVQISMIDLPKITEGNVSEVTMAEIRSQQLAQRAAAFLKEHCPGFAESRILMIPPQVGFHSNKRVQTLTMITDLDVVSGRRFSTCAASSPIPGNPSGIFDVPSESLFTEAIDNLIVTGRMIVPPAALFSTNNQPLSMLLGEAAGKLASQRSQK